MTALAIVAPTDAQLEYIAVERIWTGACDSTNCRCKREDAAERARREA